MSDINFRAVTCPSCAASFRVPVQVKAKAGRCKKCGGTIPLAAPASSAAPARPSPVGVPGQGSSPAVATPAPVAPVAAPARPDHEEEVPTPVAPPAGHMPSARRARAMSRTSAAPGQKASPLHVASGVAVLALLVLGVVIAMS